MVKIIKVEVGDVVQLRKRHPCGADTWEVTRTGVDIGLRCRGCGHRILIPRDKFRRALRNPTPGGGN